MVSKENSLFNQTEIGNLSIKNRVFMAPMTRSRASNSELMPTSLHTTYYSQRAAAGLIITEGTVVSPRATGYINVPGIYSIKQVEAWKKVTDAVHIAGGKIFIQLWHVGRLSHPDFHGGELPVAPSAINPNTEVFTNNGMTKTVIPHALTVDEIKQTVDDFALAGKNAMEAGFDGVEIHAANGYLIHQFFANCSNKRSDNYGGSNENKSRFLFEVLDALKQYVPENNIGIRLNPMLNGRLGIDVDTETAGTFDYIVQKLNSYSLAYLHFVRAVTPVEESYFIKDVIGHYRKIYKGFLVACGNYEPISAQKEVELGRADAIAFARHFISNPDLLQRIKNNWELTPYNTTTFYGGGEKGYTDYEFHK